MSKYIAQVVDEGYGIFNSEASFFIPPFYNESQEIYDIEEFVAIIYTILDQDVFETTKIYDNEKYRIDRTKFNDFLEFAKTKIQKKYGVTINFELFDFNIVFFLDELITKEDPLYGGCISTIDVIEKMFGNLYRAWKKLGNNLLVPPKYVGPSLF